MAAYPELELTVETPEVSSDDPTVRVRVNRSNGTVAVLNGEESIGTGIIDTVGALTPITFQTEGLGNTSLKIRYQNEDGEEKEASANYTRNWEEIRVTGTDKVHHLYFADGENSSRRAAISYGGTETRIRIAGEPGETIAGKPVFTEESGKPSNGNGFELNDTANLYEPTYDDLKDMQSIQLEYKNNQDVTKEIRITVLEAGVTAEPDPNGNTLVFQKAAGPVIANKDSINEESPELQVTGAIPGSRLILAINGADREDSITADEAGNAAIPGPFEADQKISIRGTDDFGKESIPDEVTVKRADLEPITITGVEPETVNLGMENEPNYTVKIHGKAHPKRSVEASLSKQGETAGETDYAKAGPASVNDQGEWTLEIPVSGKEDGIYTVTVTYGAPDNETGIRAECTFTADTKVLLAGAEEESITATEGEKTVRVRCGEAMTKEDLSLDFESADGASKHEGVQPYADSEEEGVFFWELPVPFSLKDQITITAKDAAGNEEKFQVTVVPGSFEIEMAAKDGRAVGEGEQIYLPRDNGMTFRMTGVAGTEVEASLEAEPPVPLATLIIGDPERGSYVLTADALADRNLQEGATYTLTFRRKDQDTGRQVSFIYDPKCGLTLEKTRDQNGNEKPLGEKDKIDFKTKALCGTADPGAEVTLSINGDEAGNVKTTAGADGAYEFNDLTLRPRDVIRIFAADEAGNQSETITRDVKSSLVAPAVLLAAGAILLMFSLWMLMTTRKKIRQLEDISRAKTATVQERKKR